MTQIPKVQTGDPNLLSPNAYYLYFHQRAGLQDAKKIVPRKISRYDRFSRLAEIYVELAKKMIEDLRPQYLHEEEKLNSFIRTLESHLDNKLRVGEDGKKFMMINGKTKFDASDEQYEEMFRSGKLPFAKIVREVAKELISVIRGQKPDEQGKSLIVGPGGTVHTPHKVETIGVDLDNTLIDEYEDPIPGAKEALTALKNKGYEIAVYTARFSYLPPAEWPSLKLFIEGLLKKYGIPFDKISITKPPCKYYIDDRGVKFTNWEDVMQGIENEVDETAATAMGGFGPQGKKGDKNDVAIGGQMEGVGDGIQDLKPSKLQQSKIGSGGVGGVREVELTHPVEEQVKNKGFQLLKSGDFWKDVSEQMNKNEF